MNHNHSNSINTLLQITNFQLPILQHPPQLQSIQINHLSNLTVSNDDWLGILLPELNKQISIFSMIGCNSCKAWSQQTFNQINHDRDIKGTLNDHLEDQTKKQKYQIIWKQYKKKTIKKQSITFQQAYYQFGISQQPSWKQLIITKFK